MPTQPTPITTPIPDACGLVARYTVSGVGLAEPWSRIRSWFGGGRDLCTAGWALAGDGGEGAAGAVCTCCEVAAGDGGGGLRNRWRRRRGSVEPSEVEDGVGGREVDVALLRGARGGAAG